MPYNNIDAKTYYILNKPHFKKYYLTRRDMLMEKIHCDVCKCDISRMNMNQHKRSKKHKNGGKFIRKTYKKREK